MRQIFKNWNTFLTEVRVKSPEEVISLVSSGKRILINVDKPMGTSKAFGGKEENKVKLPFDYGEWKEIINPSDNMGWDFIIVPSRSTGQSGEREESLVPLGHVKYKSDEETWQEVGKDMPENVEKNTKIIVSPDGGITKQDKQDINSFFSELIQFKDVEWY
tara:strand:+ start:511 stop:993 length:483 start_codon:yes stop_codon:yes gene_type:complete